MVTMEDVARRANVSKATVSNVITGKKHVSDELTLKVKEAVDELGYTVNLAARGLKINRTYTLGVVLPELSMMFFADVLKGIGDAANEAGYTLNFVSTGYDFSKEQEYVRDLKGKVDGIIVDSCCSIHQQPAWEQELLAVSSRRSNYPVVLIEQTSMTEKISSISIDNYSATRRCIEELVKLGRRKILYLAPPSHIQIGHRRIAGYRQAVVDYDLGLGPEYLIEGDFSTQTAYQLVKEQIGRLEFDAVLGGNDHSAIGALIALREHGIAVPEQVALVGFDNVFPSALVTPQISTIHVPRYEMGQMATRLLIEQLEQETVPVTNHRLPTEYIERQSTNPHRDMEWSLYQW